MRKKIRQITINQQVFNWIFKTADSKISHVLLVSANNKKCRITIYFSYEITYTGGNPFNEGFPFKKDNEIIVINLNQPKFINELASHILLYDDIDLTTDKEYFINGLKTLEQLGYIENK